MRKIIILLFVALFILSAVCTFCFIRNNDVILSTESISNRSTNTAYLNLEKFENSRKLQNAYKLIVNNIFELKEYSFLFLHCGFLTNEEAQIVYDSILFDYPYIFWVDDKYYLYGYDKTIILIKTRFTIDSKNELNKKRNEIKLQISEFDRKINRCDTTVEKEALIHDYLINNIKYEKSEQYEDIHNIYGALINKKASCDGYSKSFQYLSNLYKIPCTTIKGIANKENHMWNLIFIDGEYYHVDVTWDDVKEIDNQSLFSYSFFNITTNDILRYDHVITEQNHPWVNKCNSYKHSVITQKANNIDLNIQSIVDAVDSQYRHFCQSNVVSLKFNTKYSSDDILQYISTNAQELSNKITLKTNYHLGRITNVQIYNNITAITFAEA